jgi:hypothetical protein
MTRLRGEDRHLHWLRLSFLPARLVHATPLMHQARPHFAQPYLAS